MLLWASLEPLLQIYKKYVQSATSSMEYAESHGNRRAGQIHSVFRSCCGWWLLAWWEIGCTKIRLANQNKGLVISSVGSSIWHGGRRRCKHWLWGTNDKHIWSSLAGIWSRLRLHAIWERSQKNEEQTMLSAFGVLWCRYVHVLWEKRCGTGSALQSMMFLQCWNADWYYLSSAIHDISPVFKWCVVLSQHNHPWCFSRLVLKCWRLRILGVETLMTEGAGRHSSNPEKW